jgi:pyruvate/2-oxoglutarate dehydrogenase complex dihydrolipoamide acyltransferase (E2) component
VPEGADLVEAPFGGSVWKLLVATGDDVKAGDTIAVIEAMKMECPVESPAAGRSRRFTCRSGQSLQPGSPMLALRRHDGMATNDPGRHSASAIAAAVNARRTSAVAVAEETIDADRRL